MSQEIDFLNNKMIGLKETAKDTLEGQQLFIADARPRYSYDDGKRTDEVVGTTITVQVERDHDNPLSSRTFDLQTDQVLNVENIIDESVSIKIDDVKIWASSRRNSTYAEPRVTLHGTVEVEE